MCGFLGYIGSSKPFDLQAGAARIRRRGPDSLGYWKSKDEHVHISHARLAISDLRPAAAQPISNAATEQTVAFIGEIYNHLELRASLDSEFHTESDTETLLALFGKSWMGALPLLRGMFSLCVVDERRREVVLARDPVGKKPLFILPRPEGLYFSCSVLALSAAANVTEIDDDAASQWWKHGFCPPTLSVLHGCRPLLPGETLRVSFEGHIISSEKVHPPVIEKITKISTAEAVEEVDRLVRQAVRRRLSDNPSPVALLSGGIDSTVVCKYAVEAGATRLLTLAVPLLKSPDEAYAQQAADRLGVKLERIFLELSHTGERVAEAVELQDEPLAMPSFIPLSRLVAKAGIGSRVLLTGDGGDETFGGYGKPESWFENGDYVPDEPELQSGPPLPDWMSPYARRATGFDLVGHGFAKLDRSSAEQAVEARCPLLGWDLAAFVRALPREVVFCKDGVSKPLLKALLSSWPGEFLEREKAGFTYRLRWLWAASGFHGLREAIKPEAIDRFRARIPSCLTKSAAKWSSLDILNNFSTAYQLYTWSCFLRRMEEANTSYAISSPKAVPFDEKSAQPSLLTLVDSWLRGASRRMFGIGESCPSCGVKDCQMIERLSVASSLYRCRSCRLLYNLPTVKTASPASRRVWPSTAELIRLKDSRFEGLPQSATQLIKMLGALGCSPAENRLLDWGSSWGARAWQLMAEGYRVTGFETSQQCRDYAVSQMGVTTYSHESELEGLYDIFLSVDGLEHAASVSSILSEARRRVRPGGLLLIRTPNGCTQHRTKDAVYWLKHRSLIQSNHLDDVFYQHEFADQKIFLSSALDDTGPMKEWAQNGQAGLTKGDDLGGEMLVCAIRL
jgi:asparagine synthase (glutamine-hydrolysing)